MEREEVLKKLRQELRGKLFTQQEVCEKIVEMFPDAEISYMHYNSSLHLGTIGIRIVKDIYCIKVWWKAKEQRYKVEAVV